MKTFYTIALITLLAYTADAQRWKKEKLYHYEYSVSGGSGYMGFNSSIEGASTANIHFDIDSKIRLLHGAGEKPYSLYVTGLVRIYNSDVDDIEIKTDDFHLLERRGIWKGAGFYVGLTAYVPITKSLELGFNGLLGYNFLTTPSLTVENIGESEVLISHGFQTGKTAGGLSNLIGLSLNKSLGDHLILQLAVSHTSSIHRMLNRDPYAIEYQSTTEQFVVSKGLSNEIFVDMQSVQWSIGLSYRFSALL